MLSTQFIHLAIEPVTTSIAVIAGLKALGLFGAAAGGASVGRAIAGDDKPIRNGIKDALSYRDVTSNVNDIASRD
jgi:hypothetical protein